MKFQRWQSPVTWGNNDYVAEMEAFNVCCYSSVWFTEYCCGKLWEDEQEMNISLTVKSNWGIMGNNKHVICQGDLGFHWQRIEFFQAIMD